jgi:long-chain acyl-CoA synthetase
MSAIAGHARSVPRKDAVVWGNERVAYGDLDRRANQAAHALRRRGIAPGDRVAIAFRNRPEFFEAAEAVARAGTTTVPVSWRFKADEIRYMVSDSRAALLLYEPGIESEVTGLPAWSLHDYRDARDAEADTPLDDVGDFEVPEAEVYTSGTTGRPKAVERTMARPPVNFLALWGLDDRDQVHLCCAPVYHSQPRAFAQFALGCGHTVVLMEHFDAEEFLRLVEAEHVTWVSMAPVHFVRILALPLDARTRYDLSSLRLVLHSAAPCPVDVKRGVIDLFPDGTVWELYGGTEALFTMVSPDEWLQKPGTVGRAGPGITIKILDDDGHELPPNAIGTVYASQPRFSYRGAPEATAESWRGDLFTLGEMGSVDEEGFLFLADRKKDMIVTGGSNVYSAEVEAVLITHAAVADVAVIGVPDPEFGESVKAIVELARTVEADELIAWCRARLAHYKCPRSVDFVDVLPRDPNGKVRKRELRRAFGAGAVP